MIEQAYLKALSRFPTNDERERLMSLLSSTTTTTEANDADPATVPREAYEDLLWSIMTSPEFLFSH
ncbi:MAG: hypothetical protein R3C53_03210 [Pirellulaceae bacterium]